MTTRPKHLRGFKIGVVTRHILQIGMEFRNAVSRACLSHSVQELRNCTLHKLQEAYLV